jgi:hypothetical protein
VCRIDHNVFRVGVRFCAYQFNWPWQTCVILLQDFPVIRQDLTRTAVAIESVPSITRQLLSEAVFQIYTWPAR